MSLAYALRLPSCRLQYLRLKPIRDFSLSLSISHNLEEEAVVTRKPKSC